MYIFTSQGFDAVTQSKLSRIVQIFLGFALAVYFGFHDLSP